MATSPSNQPIRSISLPCRPHPLVPQIDDYLSALRSSEVTSTSVSQLSSLSHKLSNLKNVYDCLDDLIVLPQNQSKLVQSRHIAKGRVVDELLDGSLRLLDVRGIAKDVISQLKEHIKEIQSSLRRKCNGEFSIFDEIVGYMNMRKKTKMMIKRCLKDVKGMVKRFAPEGEKNDGKVAMIDVMIKEVEGVTAEIFESLLEVISGSKGQSFKRSAGLPFIMCKLIMYQNVAFEKEEAEVCLNEIEDVDATLSSLIIGQKKRNCINVMQAENLRRQMVKLDSSIQDLDEVLEGLFRGLVKNRATLLNILSL